MGTPETTFCISSLLISPTDDAYLLHRRPQRVFDCLCISVTEVILKHFDTKLYIDQTWNLTTKGEVCREFIPRTSAAFLRVGSFWIKWCRLCHRRIVQLQVYLVIPRKLTVIVGIKIWESTSARLRKKAVRCNLLIWCCHHISNQAI